MDFYEAFNYLANHEYFGGEFAESLYIEVVKVNPETLAIDMDKSKNVLTQVWLECGPIYEDYLKDNCSRYSHDIDLDCGGDTFESAIINLAELVKKYHG